LRIYTLPILAEGNYFTGTRKWNKIFCRRSNLQDQTLYVYAADNPNCFDERNLMLHLSLNNLDLKGGTFVLITTPVSTKSSVSKFKIRPNKVYCKLVFKGKLLATLISLLPKGIYDVAYITKNIPV
jgi:hypothetical protein